MEVFGVLVIFIFPYFMGYVLKEITRQKETNQIETYLIGFFFLFFLQGLVFTGSVFAGFDFVKAAGIMRIVYLVILVLFMIVAGIGLFHRRGKKQEKGMPWKKEEKQLYVMMVIAFILPVVRIFFNMDCLREDAVLETVRTTLATNTMYQYHPLTGQLMEFGMVTSRRIVSLPLYDAFLSYITSVDAQVILYVILPVQTLVAVYFSNMLLMSRIFQKNRRKVYAFCFALGILILSGDYFKGTLSYGLLYTGYAGNVICCGVMIPYLLYLVHEWYYAENDETDITLIKRIVYICKMGLCLAASVFMTGLATGLFFLFLTLVIAGLCCIIAGIKGVRECR